MQNSKEPKKFSALRASMQPKARAHSENKAQQFLAEILRHKLRHARGLTQKMLAEVLHVQQPAIVKLEKRTDMYLSILRSHIEAMGGQLDIVAHFPEGSVKISDFSKLDSNDT